MSTSTACCCIEFPINQNNLSTQTTAYRCVRLLLQKGFCQQQLIINSVSKKPLPQEPSRKKPYVQDFWENKRKHIKKNIRI